MRMGEDLQQHFDHYLDAHNELLKAMSRRAADSDLDRLSAEHVAAALALRGALREASWIDADDSQRSESEEA